MSEFMHPGIYVVEVDGAARPIDGVPNSTAALVGPVLLPRLEGVAERIAPGWVPEWTDHNESDPGVTLLNLAVWLAERVLYRDDRISDTSAASAARLATAALHALQGRELPKGTRLRKAQFFEHATVSSEDTGRQGPCVSIRRV